MPAKTVVQKMYLKQGMNIGLFNAPDNIFELLGNLPDDVNIHRGNEADGLDVMLAFIENRKMLETNLSGLKNQILDEGALWLAYHKGSSSVETDINRDSIHAFGTTLGLKGVGMVSINSNWSGFRFKKV